MKVKIMNRIWRMSKQEFDGLLKVAKEQVPFGIYAVSNKDYAELKNDVCKSKTQLKELIRTYKKQGLKVFYNG